MNFLDQRFGFGEGIRRQLRLSMGLGRGDRVGWRVSARIRAWERGYSGVESGHRTGVEGKCGGGGGCHVRS